MQLSEIATPALVVDLEAFDRNVATMANRRPGTSLRPHVKAFKSTAVARRLSEAGHTALCGATVNEMTGLAAAGLGDDLLLANECVDRNRMAALGELATRDDVRITVAIDSVETHQVARASGIREVLIDVNVGLPRCGCAPGHAAELAGRARSAGLEVRGVMGYEGHVVGLDDRSARVAGTEVSTSILSEAHREVGGDVVSGGGTGTWDLNDMVTELQAGSYLLMDTAYRKLDLPFEQSLRVLGTVLSVNRGDGYAVADIGLKSLGMDHGPPALDDATLWFCSDEHITYSTTDDLAHVSVGDRVFATPAHVDPTVARHERIHVVVGQEVVDEWPVDLRGWDPIT